MWEFIGNRNDIGVAVSSCPVRHLRAKLRTPGAGAFARNSLLRHVLTTHHANVVDLDTVDEGAEVGLAERHLAVVDFSCAVRPKHSTTIGADCHRRAAAVGPDCSDGIFEQVVSSHRPRGKQCCVRYPATRNSIGVWHRPNRAPATTFVITRCPSQSDPPGLNLGEPRSDDSSGIRNQPGPLPDRLALDHCTPPGGVSWQINQPASGSITAPATPRRHESEPGLA
jgi:hypothetical protein